MKIIALLPEKNESWILPTYLSSIKKIADEIIAIDDGSTDGSKQLLENAGVYVFENKEIVKSGWAEYSIRQKLLQIGREHGGTHFICLDADEVLSTNFLKHSRSIIEKMQPGQKITMQWVFLWKESYHYLDDKRSLFKDNYKDFIFCDREDMQHDYNFMHVGRTPGNTTEKNIIKLSPKQGVCLHFTFINWKNFMLKQAWVRCSDLIEKQESYAKINNRYYNPVEKKQYHLTNTPQEWLDGIDLPKDVEKLPPDWHLPALLKFFDKYGIEHFEKLDIWDIEELRQEFIKRTGKKPKSSKLHIYLQPVIKVKRKLKKILT